MSLLTPQSIADLLGAPLRALIQAEAIAARTTADFIKDVGFVPPGSGSSSSATVDDIGSPRMVAFRYQRLNPDGTKTESSVSVPILALIPIPSLQIAEAKIDLSLLITSAPSSGGTSMKGLIANPLLGSTLRKGTTLSSPSTQRLTMDVSITLRQADLTHGMVGMLNMLTDGITDSRREVRS